MKFKDLYKFTKVTKGFHLETINNPAFFDENNWRDYIIPIKKITGIDCSLQTPVKRYVFNNHISQMAEIWQEIRHERRIEWVKETVKKELDFRVRNWWSPSVYQNGENILYLKLAVQLNIISKEREAELLDIMESRESDYSNLVSSNKDN